MISVELTFFKKKVRLKILKLTPNPLLYHIYLNDTYKKPISIPGSLYDKQIGDEYMYSFLL